MWINEGFILLEIYAVLSQRLGLGKGGLRMAPEEALEALLQVSTCFCYHVFLLLSSFGIKTTLVQFPYKLYPFSKFLVFLFYVVCFAKVYAIYIITCRVSFSGGILVMLYRRICNFVIMLE